MTLAELMAFHDRWFAPRNGSLVIVGAVTEAAALALVNKYFGSIQGGISAPRWEAELPRLRGQVLVEVAAPVHAASVQISWPTASLRAAGDA